MSYSGGGRLPRIVDVLQPRMEKYDELLSAGQILLALGLALVSSFALMIPAVGYVEPRLPEPDVAPFSYAYLVMKYLLAWGIAWILVRLLATFFLWLIAELLGQRR